VRILVFGGTIFVGRHFVESALERGHEVTLFHRGQHGLDLFPEVERLQGDRERDLNVLGGRSWDAAVDTCGYVPRVVGASVDALRDAVGRYLFVSTIAAYASFDRAGLDESAPLAELEEPGSEDIQRFYGPLKARCEREVARLGTHALVVRPGLIVGPQDPTDRFTYWVRLVAAGGDVLAPGRPERRVQVIDSRDLALWMVRLLEDERGGAYNAVGPEGVLTMGELLETCRSVSGSDARIVWVPEDELLGAGVEPWSELPLWIPESDGEMGGFLAFDASAAIAHGLRFRPLAATVADTLSWDRVRTSVLRKDVGVDIGPVGLSAEREAQLRLRLAGRRALRRRRRGAGRDRPQRRSPLRRRPPRRRRPRRRAARAGCEDGQPRRLCRPRRPQLPGGSVQRLPAARRCRRDGSHPRPARRRPHSGAHRMGHARRER
jgi:2'-hydroxyisoflavone reductase